jgi:hypothetical protein
VCVCKRREEKVLSLCNTVVGMARERHRDRQESSYTYTHIHTVHTSSVIILAAGRKLAVLRILACPPHSWIRLTNEGPTTFESMSRPSSRMRTFWWAKKEAVDVEEEEGVGDLRFILLVVGPVFVCMC